MRKKLFAMLAVALVLVTFAAVAPAATGRFPTAYGCAFSLLGRENGLAGGTYINSGYPYGIAWAITASNYHYRHPSVCSTNTANEAAVDSLGISYEVDRTFLGQRIRCAYGTINVGGRSRQDISIGMPVANLGPCTWDNYPRGLTDIYIAASYTMPGINTGTSFHFTS